MKSWIGLWLMLLATTNSAYGNIYDPEDANWRDVIEGEIKFTREHSFGSDGDILLGRLFDIAVDHSGRVYMADGDHVAIHVFAPDGNYLKSLGRQGHGPGEFDIITSRTKIKFDENNVYVTDGYDFFLQRMHVFSIPDLSFSITINANAENKKEYGEEMVHYFPYQIYPLRTGEFLVSYQHVHSPAYLQRSENSIKYFLHNRDGKIISGPFLEQEDKTYLYYEYPGRRFTFYAFSFLPKPLIAVSHDNLIYAAHSDQFQIDVYNAKGIFQKSIQHPFKNISLSRRELIEMYEDIDLSRLDMNEGDDVALRMIREADDLPDTWPALDNLLVDDENRLWVSTIVEDFDIYEWWVLKESGELITKFEWPRDEPIEVVKNGKMFTRQTDEETGLVQVVRYGIELE